MSYWKLVSILDQSGWGVGLLTESEVNTAGGAELHISARQNVKGERVRWDRWMGCVEIGE